MDLVLTETFTVQTKNYKIFSIHSSNGTCIETITNERVKYCLPGDTVVLNSQTNCYMIVSRAKYPLLAGYLELTSKTKYGMTKKGHPMYLFLPFRKEFPPFIVGCSEKKPTKNRLALVEFENWLPSSHLPRGSLQQMIGTCGDFDAEKKALLLTHSPWKYPSKMAIIVTDPFEKYMKGEMTPPFTFSIDPPGCRDVDDVISIFVKENCTELWISIADVASVIPYGSALDEYAFKISQTTYSNGEVMRPMLPLEYSHDICSLLQCQVRPGISLILSFYQDHMEKRWARTNILNMRQYTYDNFLEKGTLDGIPIDLLKECLAKLEKGNLSEDIHKWVEIAMLTYNKEAAALLRTAQIGVLRSHSGADDERWTAYEALKPGLGRLAEASAQYCFPADDVVIHKGLGADVYCHASSPIRRYADLVNQRAIHAILDKKEKKIQKISWKDLYHMNQRQKDTKRYERDMAFLEIIEKSQKEQQKQQKQHQKPVLTALILGKRDVYTCINTWKYSLWIDEWNQIVSWKTTDVYEVGQTLELSYFLDMDNRFWKDRIVFRANLT